MKNSLLKLSGSILILTLPVLTYAAGIDGLISNLSRWLRMLLPILVGVAVVVFIWGLIVFISKANDETAREEGKKRMIWGIIALFVMVSIWGLVNYIGTTLDIRQDNAQNVDKLIPR